MPRFSTRKASSSADFSISFGLRTRSRLMHDGATVTPHEAILRHDRDARPVVQSYLRLSKEQRGSLMVFLSSL
jgi:CxxC motif-containing protein (DUF1111 family)